MAAADLFARHLSEAFRQKAATCEAALSGPGPSEDRLPPVLGDLAAALRRCAAVYRAAADYVDAWLARGAVAPGARGPLDTPRGRRLLARLTPAEEVVSAAQRRAVAELERGADHG